MSNFKKVKNTTHQSLEVITKMPSGQYDHIWLASKKSVIVPTESLTDMIHVAVKRQMLKITNA